MLLNRFRICLLIGAPWLVGCGGGSGDYRPLTETSADSSPTAQLVVEQNAAPMSESETEKLVAAPTSSPSEPVAPSGKAAPSDPAPLTTEKSGAEKPAAEKMIAAITPAAEGGLTTEEKKIIPGGNRGMLSQPSKVPEKPLEIKLLIPQKEFVREGKNQSLRVTFDDLDLLKVCNMEPVPPDVMDHLPEWLKNLNGQKIILRGWMFPSGRQEGISSFMFVRDNGICCFGRDPKVYDKLAVTMLPGKTTKYIAGRPFDVEATLYIDPDIEGAEEGLWWLYRLENARVIDQ